MADPVHLAQIEKGADAWNAWRRENAKIRPDLTGAPLGKGSLSSANLVDANLRGADLRRADLSDAHLGKADLIDADLSEAFLANAYLGGAFLFNANLIKTDFRGANLEWARLQKANLEGADLSKANLRGAFLSHANLRGARLRNANLASAKLDKADLREADLSEANLSRAYVWKAILIKADLRAADLRAANLGGALLGEADLRTAILVDTDLTNTDLTGCRIYGVSAWNLKLDGTKQQNLVITDADEFEGGITVDNIEVAQFIYLLLQNQKIRTVIDTITSKAVLILGRFTEERKAVLDAIREELRRRDYLPILFDFDKPASRDLTSTVSTLAHMARFIIADVTDPSSIPYELATIVPTNPVPIKPIILSGCKEFAMFADLRKFPWVLATHRYKDPARLIADLGKRVIEPAETKVRTLLKRTSRG